jgi:hypothetical protein
MVDVTATIDWSGALTPGAQAALARALTAGNAGIERINAWRTKRHAEMVAEARRDPGRLQLLPSFDADFAGLAEAIANPNPRAIQNATNERDRIDVIRPMLQALAVDRDIGLPALLKTIRWFNLMTHPNGALHHDFCHAINARTAALSEPALTELGQALIDMGISARAVILATVGNWQRLATFPSIQGALPFYRQHVAALVGCFEPATLSHDGINRRSLYLIFEGFDDPPAALVDRLFELALGSGKTERGPAQAALDARTETFPRIVAALADGKAETRTQAANWLARLRYAPALPALEKAVRSEKNDVAKGALLDALQRLGQPVSSYIDRAALLKDAQKLLAKPLPDELKWMAWETMPVVRWADGGAAVETDVLRYLIVNACKQKTPEPNAVLRKYCELFEPGDRARFGEWMLASWIAADSKPHPYEVVQRSAQKNAQSMYDFYQRSAAADDPLRARTVEQWYARYLTVLAKQPVGSEIASKGVLAVAAACGSAALAPPTARYLKDFYGTRAAHCKALIAMLAWVEHPSATQLMLAIGKRFRTKGIQEEANKQALLLAERNDWTLDELADRTIPTGGLDDDGVLDLSYGERAFSAVLVPDTKAGMKLELRHPDGKTIASLPEPRADDDAELAAAAKKNLALAKKEIKTAIDAQTQRLYEAMCTSRTWRFDLFDRYLNRHPLMSHLVQRLVWCAGGTSFRPMADGSLSGNDDTAVTLAPEAEIRIAHDLWLDDAAIAAWRQHLSDYDIKPLFQQFGKGRYTLPDAKAEALTDARGVVMDAFTLRGRMAKLGFARGPVEDGPSFNIYEKRLPSLQLGVILEFSGNSMPEENRKIALIEMRFVRLGELQYQMQTLPLGDVPPVLLAESHHDLKTLARDGVLDPEWQKRFDH